MDIFSHEKKAYLDATYNPFLEEVDDGPQNLSEEAIANLSDEERQNYYQAQFKHVEGDELTQVFDGALGKNDDFEDDLTDAQKRLKKYIRKLNDPEKIAKGQDLLKECERLLMELDDAEDDITTAKDWSAEHHVEVKGDYAVEGLSYDGGTYYLNVDVPVDLFSDDDVQDVTNDEGEVVVDVNYDGKMNMDDIIAAEREDPLLKSNIILTEGDVRIHKIDPITNTLELVIFEKGGSDWTRVVIKNFTQVNLVFDKLTEDHLEFFKDNIPPEYLKNWYAGNDDKSLFERLHIQNMETTERLQVISGYDELLDEDSFTAIADHLKNQTSEDYTKNLSNYENMIEEFFIYQDNPNSTQTPEQFIAQFLSDSHLALADKKHLIHLFVVEVLKQAPTMKETLLAPIAEELEKILIDGPSPMDRAIILLIETQLEFGGAYGGSSIVWTRVFSPDGERAGEWPLAYLIDFPAEMKVFDYYESLLNYLDISIPEACKKAKENERELWTSSLGTLTSAPPAAEKKKELSKEDRVRMLQQAKQAMGHK